jgi:hypothetical protein
MVHACVRIRVQNTKEDEDEIQYQAFFVLILQQGVRMQQQATLCRRLIAIQC